MLDQIRGYIFWICGGVVLIGVIAYIFAITGSGTSFFGDSNGTLEPTNFKALNFSLSENGYLLCSKDICPNAKANGQLANFPGDIRRLRLILADFADDNPTIRFRSFNPVTNQFEFSERSPGHPLPAVISIKLIEVANKKTEMAIYTYQPIGDSSLDDHKNRINRWLRLISNRLVRFTNQAN